MKKYWYRFTAYICVLCGREDRYKERMYTRKPKAYWKRHREYQDACGYHFI